jgi:hypothetical protein
MKTLRGTGKTFSTSGKRWLPFHHDPRHAKKMARLRRLQRKGLTPATDKASLREAAVQAVAARKSSQPDGEETSGSVAGR